MRTKTALMASALAVTVCGCASPGGQHAAFDVRPARLTDAAIPPSDLYYADAVAAIGRRDYARALDLLQAARARSPADARVLNAFGVVYDKLGRFDLSQRYYAQAQAADPASAIVAQNLAYSRALQNSSTAVALAEVAIPLPPAPARRLPETIPALGPPEAAVAQLAPAPRTADAAAAWPRLQPLTSLPAEVGSEPMVVRLAGVRPGGELIRFAPPAPEAAPSPSASVPSSAGVQAPMARSPAGPVGSPRPPVTSGESILPVRLVAARLAVFSPPQLDGRSDIAQPPAAPIRPTVAVAAPTAASPASDVRPEPVAAVAHAAPAPSAAPPAAKVVAVAYPAAAPIRPTVAVAAPTAASPASDVRPEPVAAVAHAAPAPSAAPPAAKVVAVVYPAVAPIRPTVAVASPAMASPALGPVAHAAPPDAAPTVKIVEMAHRTAAAASIAPAAPTSPPPVSPPRREDDARLPQTPAAPGRTTVAIVAPLGARAAIVRTRAVAPQTPPVAKAAGPAPTVGKPQTFRPVLIVYTGAVRYEAEQLRLRLARLGWTLGIANRRAPAPRITTIRYDASYQRLAKALARSLRAPVSLERCRAACPGLTVLVSGRQTTHTASVTSSRSGKVS